MDMMDNVDIKQSGKKFFADVKINKAECVFCWISFAIATINLILFIINFIKGLTCTEKVIDTDDKEENL